MSKLVIAVATGNQHKLVELEELFAGQGLEVELRSMKDLGLSMEIDETGSTFEENAYIKARAVFDVTGLPTLADDSGIEIDALNNEPGVYSARYAGADATDADNREKVRREFASRGIDTSHGRFRCVLCYVDSQRTLFGEGSCEGNVIPDERGDQGFGYDPQFIPVGHDETFAELGMEVKQQLSHRALAVADLSTRLTSYVHEAPSPQPSLPSIRETVIRASTAAALNDQQTIAELASSVSSSETHLTGLYEALLQSYLFGGFPTALDALTTMYSAVSEKTDWRPPSDEQLNFELFRSRGEALCKDVYGSVYPKMVERLSEITPDLASWMIAEGYGKTLSRTGLDTVARELGIVAILSALQREQQLISHVRGAFNVGATTDDVEECYSIVAEQASPTSTRMLRKVIDRFSE